MPEPVYAMTYKVEIWIAGDISVARQVCRRFCETGLCVTIETVDFIYTGGQESGVRVGLLNYPRFPDTKENIWNKAKALAVELRDGMYQDSVLVCDDAHTLWISRRNDNSRPSTQDRPPSP